RPVRVSSSAPWSSAATGSSSRGSDEGGAMSAPVFVGCSHGTDSVTGRAAIRSILDDVAAARPDLDVREAFVDVQLPEVADVVAESLAGRSEQVRGDARAHAAEQVVDQD